MPLQKRKNSEALPPLSIERIKSSEDQLSLKLSGHLSAKTADQIWKDVVHQIETARPGELVLDVTALEYCDMTGVAFFQRLEEIQHALKSHFQLVGLRADYQKLLDLAALRVTDASRTEAAVEGHPLERLGRNVAGLLSDFYDQIAFVGETVVHIVRSLLKPQTICWKDVWSFIEKAGADAVPLIMMAGFLIGVIMAFQSALPLKQMGSDVFVANVVAFAVLRELGPLMTAIILAGRSGSAIAAEIGTMKINEEVNALTTMGIEPVRFLVVSRMLGILFLAPLLTVIADFFGMLGGAVVFQSFGYASATYLNQITSTVDLSDVMGGIFKAIPFAFAIGGIGCLRGLQTKTGASAVGQSTTSSVVSGMVLIIILDGIISALYFVLGI